ncbi:hypothetical protein M1432_01680 [Patescibacteria group bacterium]|nr:hypothetical protein [Patescibacteria group bacterium]
MVKKLRGSYFAVPLMALVASALVAGVALAVSSPTNLQATAQSACQIQTQWTKVSGASSYILESSPNPTFVPATSYNAGSGNPRSSTAYYNVNGLAPKTQLYFQVEAVDSSGNTSSWSPAIGQPSVSAATPDMNDPTQPYFTGATGQYGNKQIQMKFATSSPINAQYGGWNVQYRTSSDGVSFGNWTNVSGQTPPATYTSYTDNGGGNYLNTNLVYQYQVQDYDGGIGCSQYWYSFYSNPITVPTVPANLSVSYSFDVNKPAGQQNTMTLSWNASKAADGYEVWRSTSQNSGYAWIASTTATTYPDSNITTSQTYYYEVRAFNKNNANGAVAYSDYSPAASKATYGAPQNLKAFLAKIYQSGSQTLATINLTWSNTYPGSDYYMAMASGINATTGFKQIGVTPHAGSGVATMSTTTTVTAGSGYTFCVQAAFGSQLGPCSPSASIDTNVVPLSGFAWNGYTGNTGGGGPVGIGWIDFAPTGTSPGVYMNKTTGALSGYAWASNGGWLSFNSSDIGSGCPTGGNCAPTINQSTGAASGWARFTAANPSQGAWTGWVSLNKNSQDNYSNVSYDSTSGNFNGYAWTDLGWISFNGTAADGSAYCVTTGSGCSQSGQAPQIIATSTGIDSSTGKAWINIKWNNLQPYGSVSVEISPANNPSAPKLLFSAKRTFLSGNSQDRPFTQQTNNLSYTITGLSTSTTYGLFVRGCQSATSCN